jgi:hypothetical protein
VNKRRKTWWFLTVVFCLSLILAGCGIFSGQERELIHSPTPTPTEVGSGIVPTEEQPTHPCETVSGTLELQILVGPAEAVGLTPTSVGRIPFRVIADGGVYRVEGGGPFDYYVETLSHEWGTYTVTFDGDANISGDCVSTEMGGMLNINIELIGEQNVEVIYEGVSQNYPWSGTPQITVNLPIEEGAQQAGEGWVIILHLGE